MELLVMYNKNYIYYYYIQFGSLAINTNFVDCSVKHLKTENINFLMVELYREFQSRSVVLNKSYLTSVFKINLKYMNFQMKVIYNQNV